MLDLFYYYIMFQLLSNTIGFTYNLLLLLSINVEARPISYSGGSTAMLITDNMKDSIYYHYSPTYKYSVGIEKVRDLIFDQELY